MKLNSHFGRLGFRAGSAGNPGVHFGALGLMLFCCALLSASDAAAETILFQDSWGKAGIQLVQQDAAGVELVFSIPRLEITEMEMDGETMQNLIIPGVVLPNNAGAPNLPGVSRFIAVPQGAWAEVEIVSYRTEVLRDLNIAPAFKIPRGDDDRPLEYRKDPAIYNADAFYPRTSIRFGLPQAGWVKLSVYDLLGRQVAVLADGPREAGQHQIAFDASALASGIYLYRLEAGAYSATKKMILMK